MLTIRGHLTGLVRKPLAVSVEFRRHFKGMSQKLKNNRHRVTKVGGGNAPSKVYAVGHAGTNTDSNVVTGTFLLNNRYASILFDTGADRSFVSTAFSSQIDITPTALESIFFDAIIGMDWLVKYQAIIVCAEKIVRIPWGNETLIVHGDGSNRGNEARSDTLNKKEHEEHLKAVLELLKKEKLYAKFSKCEF
ncbi:putative reverse transcriptase domain-containing protein [Tanacetum coccineum]